MGIALSILDISENSSALSYDYNCHSINVYTGITGVKKKKKVVFQKVSSDFVLFTKRNSDFQNVVSKFTHVK